MPAPTLITGATGFLGRTLCPYLIERGYHLRAFARASSDVDFLHELGVEIALGDVCDAASIQTAAEGCRAIVHAAGKFRFWGQPENFFAANQTGTRNTLEAARRANVERFVHISTVAVIGAPRNNAPIDEAYPPTPRDAYQRSKLEAERLALRYYQTHHVPVVVLRPGAFYGPGSHYAFNRLFFDDPLKGLPVQVHGGKRINFPVYIEDVAQGVDLALKKGRPGEIYNVSGPSISHREANQIIDQILGYRIHRINVPTWMMLTLARFWTWLSRYTHREPYYPLNLALYVFHDWNVSSEKAQRELGFTPTPFETGARETLAWYASQNVQPSNWMTRLIQAITRRKA